MFFYFVYDFKKQHQSFYDLLRPLFLVLVYGFNLQQGNVITWQDVCSYYFVYRYKINNSFNDINSTDKVAGKYPGLELKT